jgi:hypothetical protein
VLAICVIISLYGLGQVFCSIKHPQCRDVVINIISNNMTLSPSSSTVELTQIFHHSTAVYDYRIRWTSLGDATLPPLIFVHGTPWSSRVWHVYAQSLAQYFRVYLFDNPGFGDSPQGKPIPGKKDTISKGVALDADLTQQ